VPICRRGAGDRGHNRIVPTLGNDRASLVLWPRHWWIYGCLAIALVLSFWVRLPLRAGSRGKVGQCALKWSNTYLHWLFLAVAVDALLLH